MKLRNKKTGEIPEKIETIAYIQWSKMIMMVYINNDGERIVKQYDSLETFNEEWEDYEEPENFYIVEQRGTVGSRFRTGDEYEKMFKEIGNYFKTKEEAEKAVEKLKAWKRLKNSGFRFTGFEETDRGCLGDFTIYCYVKPDYTRPYDDVDDDLDLLFGGEE